MSQDSDASAPGLSPRQDLSEEQQTLLVQLQVVRPQIPLQAPHHRLNPYLKRAQRQEIRVRECTQKGKALTSAQWLEGLHGAPQEVCLERLV